ncbi:MAG: LysR family transcriptional regulator [Candidatus Sericytochromatia bacterium]|nr:LysR family transcriptional regulator [Candidatus Tanganyikabacteria bacterium]
MQIEYLKTFAAAADLKSFTRAAEVCSLSQPAVSQQIKELESYFGHSLFDRSSRNLTLTAAGERLREHVARILAQLKAAREDLEEIKGEPSGTVAVGAGNTIGIYLLPQILGDFRKAYPLVHLTIRVGATADLLQALSWKELDVALFEEEVPPGKLRDLEQIPYADDEVVLIAPSGHPWSKRGRISVQDLLGTPLVMRQWESPTRQLILRSLAEAGLDTSQMDINLEVGNTEALKRMVLAGVGLAFVSRFAIAQELRFGTLNVIDIGGVTIRRKLWLVSPKSGQMPERLARFSEFITKHPPKLSEATPAQPFTKP